jgi:hypothetical protein
MFKSNKVSISSYYWQLNLLVQPFIAAWASGATSCSCIKLSSEEQVKVLLLKKKLTRVQNCTESSALNTQYCTLEFPREQISANHEQTLPKWRQTSAKSLEKRLVYFKTVNSIFMVKNSSEK